MFLSWCLCRSLILLKRQWTIFWKRRVLLRTYAFLTGSCSLSWLNHYMAERKLKPENEGNFVLAICLNQVLNIRWSHICFCFFSKSISCFSAIADCKSKASHSYAWKIPVLLLYSPILWIHFNCYQYQFLETWYDLLNQNTLYSSFFYKLMGCSGQHRQHFVSLRRSVFQWCWQLNELENAWGTTTPLQVHVAI